MVYGDDTPTRAGMDAENIILNLVNDPRAFLSQDTVQCVFALDQSLSVITEEERLTLRKLADTAMADSIGLWKNLRHSRART